MLNNKWSWAGIAFLLGAIVGIAGAILYTSVVRTADSASPIVHKELLSQFPLNAPIAIGEEAISLYPFSIEYPRVPCATWENGGLSWWYSDLHGTREEKIWSIWVWWPIWRFCGLPDPYPKKPSQELAQVLVPPEEWTRWREMEIPLGE